ncbi:Short-chain-enoyl-CoA hydratase [Diplonema papillatum]|nr:Short-chain-enoyl-CoA hydratase [Diplonema papillatum]
MPGGTIQLFPKNGAPVEYELQLIEYSVRPNGVAVCMWDNHKTRNALTPLLQAETFFVLEHMARDDSVKVAVWTGRNNWGSGIGLGAAGERMPPAAIQRDYKERNMYPHETDNVLKNLTLAFWDFPKPSVAAVTGFAIGGAANMALMNQHDLVVVADDSKFYYPSVKLGLVPELGSSYLLPYLVGTARAKEIMYLGEPFSGTDAHSWGLANKSVHAAAVLPEALSYADRIAAQPNPSSIRYSKQLLNHHLRKHLDDVLAKESEIMYASVHSVGGKPTIHNVMKKRAKL